MPMACKDLCGTRLKREGPVGIVLNVLFNGAHFTCLTCRRRRKHYGKMPTTYKAKPRVINTDKMQILNDIQVVAFLQNPMIFTTQGEHYLIMPMVGRRFEKIKEKLIDLLLTTKTRVMLHTRYTLAEFFAN